MTESHRSNRNHRFNRALGALLCVLTIVPAGAALGAAGAVTTVRGFASAATDDGAIRALAVGNDVNSGETIVTATNSFLRMKLTDGSYIVLRPNTRFQIEDYEVAEEEPERNRGFFSLLRGGFRAVTGAIAKRNRESYKFRTAVATIGIRGTDLEVIDCTDGCPDLGTDIDPGVYLKVHQGGVDFGDAPFEAGQDAFGAGGGIDGIGAGENPLTTSPTGSAEPCE